MPHTATVDRIDGWKVPSAYFTGYVFGPHLLGGFAAARLFSLFLVAW